MTSVPRSPSVPQAFPGNGVDPRSPVPLPIWERGKGNGSEGCTPVGRSPEVTPTPEPVQLWHVALERHDGVTRHRVLMNRDALDALLEVIKDAGDVRVWTATTEWQEVPR